MIKIMEKEELVRKNKYYSIMMIHRLGLFEWVSSYDALKRLILRDITNGNKNFNVVVYGKGNGKRYKIRGSTILKILKAVKEGYTFNNY